eukprot:TRINITY_DN13741_c0_g1_i1.p1 TRINITY_DN13741_c0_g1~~TRINITY_DN13741_c0_g1_i1.p1  ORF type:complete len:427 (-),score=98.89 TRINITY_DN13741_c0_g1_i1:44-1324(-)
MVASDPQDAAESQPWLWSDLLMGLLSGASCQVQKVPTSYGEVVDVVREKGSRPPPGNAFADSALDSSEASPAVTTQSETVPTELGFDKEDQPHSDDGAHSGSTDANSPANESHEVSAESPPDISQIKVFAYAPGSLASCGNNELARQCCHKLCHAPCTGVDVVDPAQGFQPSQQVESRRALSGARFCVLVHDGAGILEPRQNRENKAGEVMPAFREAFAEAVAEAAGVSVSRVRVLDVGPPLQVWARSSRLAVEAEEASGSPSPSTSGSSSEDTGAGVLRFLMADEDLRSSAGVPQDQEPDHEPVAAAASQDTAGGPGSKEPGPASQNASLRVLAVIREQADLDELSGSTADSTCLEEPGALRAVELVMRQVEDPGSRLQQALASWAGGEPVVACVTEDRTGNAKLRGRQAGGRRRPRRGAPALLK